MTCIMSVTFNMLQINITIIYLIRQTQTTHRNIVQVSLVGCMCGVGCELFVQSCKVLKLCIMSGTFDKFVPIT